LPQLLSKVSNWHIPQLIVLMFNVPCCRTTHS